MEIGDLILYRGRRYCVWGFSRASGTEQWAILYDPAVEEFRTLPIAELEDRLGLRASCAARVQPSTTLADDAAR